MKLDLKKKVISPLDSDKIKGGDWTTSFSDCSGNRCCGADGYKCQTGSDDATCPTNGTACASTPGYPGGEAC